MGLRDLLKKKDDVNQAPDSSMETIQRLNGPEFALVRSDTHTYEIIHPPGHPQNDNPSYDNNYLSTQGQEPRKSRRSLDVFRSRSASASDGASGGTSSGKRLSQRLHLTRAPASSERVPQNLPDIVLPADPKDQDGAESQWEHRATMLASQNEMARSRPGTPSGSGSPGMPEIQVHQSPDAGNVVSSKATDSDIQEAIRLHEAGDLQASTRLFGRLADPHGANNPLSQVLYGLALRHGWGCAPDPAGAVRYLSAAASNAASVEQLALQAGLKKGGAAKGELVLAIFELANCFRHGWGIPKDPLAAKQYYETAANLGDSDAMNETGWCYLEGFGCKKDKFAAARYYRLAEKAGSKTIGNSWAVFCVTDIDVSPCHHRGQKGMPTASTKTVEANHLRATGSGRKSTTPNRAKTEELSS
jgi:TPR repeat protein